MFPFNKPDGPFLYQGKKGELVRVVQEALNHWNYSVDGEAVEVDGYYGPQTKIATQRFQKNNGRKPTGQLDYEAFELLIWPMKLRLKKSQNDLLNESDHPVEASSSSASSTRWLAHFFQHPLSKTGFPIMVGLLLLCTMIVVTTSGYTTKLSIKDMWEFFLSPSSEAPDQRL